MESLRNKNIGVLMGGLSPERDVSLTSGKEIFRAIKNRGLNAEMIDVDHKIGATLVEKKIDLACIALHGTWGEDGTIQGILEYLKIPYTGSGVLGSAIAYNKVVSKEIFVERGIPTANYQVITAEDRKNVQRTLELPVVVKPSDQGSSIGVSIVHTEAQWETALDRAFEISEEILIEQFIEGKLLAVGMNGSQPMPIIEIVPKSGFYDYEAKYTEGKTDYICPADLTPEEVNRCNDAAAKVFKALKGRGFPRVDIILEGGTPYVLEMNTIPGMTPTSLLPMAARKAGMDFDDLVIEILKRAQLDYKN
ncbi:MAG: D-alanine--D-alanine ligase [Nitrospinota bacterium]|nr:D-alanine--D-alanine ligase [Nitrospinota bacterium]